MGFLIAVIDVSFECVYYIHVRSLESSSEGNLKLRERVSGSLDGSALQLG